MEEGRKSQARIQRDGEPTSASRCPLIYTAMWRMQYAAGLVTPTADPHGIPSPARPTAFPSSGSHSVPGITPERPLERTGFVQ